MSSTVIMLLVVTSILWGVAPIFDKMALSSGITPFQGTAVRNMIIAVILMISALLTGKATSLFLISPRSLIFLAASGIVAGCLGVFTFYKALQLSETSRIVPLAATYPLVTAILSIVFLKETLTWERFLGTILIIIGIWFVK
ncbi:MAG: EamA family transporter [Elusimicrobia bacterium]|nr:EamA family transporter [Elusimicrobiota bacterium]